MTRIYDIALKKMRIEVIHYHKAIIFCFAIINTYRDLVTFI